MRLRQRMNCSKLFRGLRVDYAHLVILVSAILPLPLTKAAEPITLKVEATRGLPGLHHSALSCWGFRRELTTEPGVSAPGDKVSK